MGNRGRDSLFDDVLGAYVAWRQQCAEVESAYRRWSIARSTETAPAFAAYAAALDREELASISYAQAIQRTTVPDRGARRRGRQLRDAA